MKRHLTRLGYFLKDKDKKPFTVIVKEVVSLWALKREFPFHYFGRFFYRKNAPDGKMFMSLKEYNTLAFGVEKRAFKYPEIREVFQDKLLFSKQCSKFNIHTPEILSYNFGSSFFYNEVSTTLNSPEDLILFFKRLFESEKLDSLFLKVMDSNSGKGAMLLRRSNLVESSDMLWKNLKSSNYIHQEVIQQHPEINKIYSKSINTFRIETYLDKSKVVHLLGSHMRFGSGDSFLDNISQGGFYVNVNLDRGTFQKYGLTNMIHGGKAFTSHPDTGFEFEDFKIPYFSESVELVKKAARCLSNFVNSWDIAITQEGPILIEGNNHPSFLTGEYSYGGYKNKPVFKEIFEEIKNIKAQNDK